MNAEDTYSTLRDWLVDGFATLNQGARTNWFEGAEIAYLMGKLSPDLPANDLAPQLLRVAYIHDGEVSLRKIVLYLREQHKGYEEPQTWLDSLLAQPDLASLLFPHGPDSWADDPKDALRAALARFRRMPDSPPSNLPLPVIRHIPFHRNPDFVGREAELQMMTTAIKAGQSVAVVAAGLGGVGKTQLAVEWLYRYGYYFQGGVFWLDFSDPASISLAIATAGNVYRWRDYEQLDLAGQVAKVRAQWNTELPTLLIFDNCEKPELVQEYAPKQSGARVLVTSRDQTWGQKVRGMRQIAIETLPRPDSIALLQRLRPDLSNADANTIAEEVGDLPLALHIAGSFLAAYPTAEQGNPTEYLKQLKASNPVKKLNEQGERLEKRNVDQPTRHSRDVERTFRINMERLAQEETSDTLLLLIAHFAPGVNLPVAWLNSALPEGTDEFDAQDALDRLVAVGLVEAPQGGWVRMHRLVAQVVIGAAEAETATATMSQSENILLEVAPEYGQPDFVLRMEEWLPHARHIASRALPRRDRQADILAFNVGYQLKTLALYEEANHWYEQSVDISRVVWGATHFETATSLNDLADLYRVQGLYDRALHILEKVVTIYREALGAHPYTATGLNNLAGLYQRQGLYDRALPLYEESLVITREALGARHPNTATRLNNLAMLYQAQGMYERALPLYEEALAIKREALGVKHPSLATSLNNLAGLYDAQGMYERALPLYEEALAIKREALGVKHPSLATSLNNLAGLYQRQGMYDRALPLYEEALAIDREVLGARHPDTATDLNNLALLYKTQERYDRALPLYEEAVSILVERLGMEHPNTKAGIRNRDGCIAAMGKG